MKKSQSANFFISYKLDLSPQTSSFHINLISVRKLLHHSFSFNCSVLSTYSTVCIYYNAFLETETYLLYHL